MHLRALLAIVAALTPAAVRGQEPVPAPATQSPLAPPAAPPSTFADKSAALTGEWVTSGRCPGPVFGLDLMLGQQSGIRPSLAVYSTERAAFVVEGYYGGLFTKFGASETAGAGVRWVTSRGGIDSVTFGPGVDILFHLNRGKAVILAPTVDVAWRRNFGERAAFVLGINAGIGVGLSGYHGNDRDDPIAGKVTPIISFYTGLRF